MKLPRRGEHPAPPEQHEDDELIDDRALESAKEDRFRHQDFAEELARTILTVRTPANIALYGAWGSGKSGLGNMLNDQLQSKKGVRFLRFDAFKYAELPLRRHFISQVASQLKVNDPKYSRGLYRTIQDSSFEFPKADFFKLLWVFLAVLATVFAVALGVIALVAWLAKGSFGSNLAKFVGTGLALAFAPASLVAGFVTLTGNTLTIKRSTDAPSSDEEFEDLFKELVDASKAERLVIFVDELDRCSAKEVVETLDTVRTFLDVQGCVFVVAADQQVLEQALQARVRQTTPIDAANPYYSAGSAYLDKVFHYQLSLPPLTPRRLSRFALELVSQKGGLWREIDQAGAVSVLIPTHVRSPRRVKVLLNNFVLEYRLAQRRVRQGLLPEGLKERALELAKLVCLRTEFPLFAADLSMNARLTSFVLELSRNPTMPRPSAVTDEVWERARQYAIGELPLDTNLASQTSADATEESAEPAEPESPDDPEAADQPAATSGAGKRDAIQDTQHEQLLRYLSRTQHVAGPGRDLVFLESSGAAFGLDPGLAEQIEDLAVDGQVEGVVRILGDLDDDEESAALRMLAQRIREAPPDLEAHNATSTLLQALGSKPEDTLDELGDELAEAISAHQSSYELREADLPGAYRLGLGTNRPAGRVLVDKVLARGEVLANSELAAGILRSSEHVIGPHASRLGQIIVALLFDEQTSDLTSILLSQNDELALALIRAAVPAFAARCEEESENADALGYATTGGAELLDAALESSRHSIASAATELLLSGDTTELRNEVESRLQALGSVDSPSAVIAVLRACHRRAVSKWPTWLDLLDADAVAESEASASLASLATALWNSAVRTDDKAASSEDVARAAEALGALVPSAVDQSGLLTAINEAVSGAVTTPDALALRDTELNTVRRFCDSGIIEIPQVTNAIVSSMVTLAGVGITPQPIDSPFTEVLLRWARWSLPSAATERAQALGESLGTSPWLQPPAREILRLEVAARLKSGDASIESPFTPEELRAALDAHGDAFSEGIGVWLRVFARTTEDVWQVVEPFASASPAAVVADALRAFAEGLSPAERLQLASRALDSQVVDTPTEEFLSALRFSESDQKEAAQKLVSLFNQATNVAGRRKALRCWSALKPVRDADRRLLVESILLQLARKGGENYDLAVDYLPLAVPPPKNMKKKIGATFLDEVSVSNDRRDRAAKKLRSAGLAKSTGFIKKKTRPIDE